MVLAHARVLLTSTPEGACDYLDADVRDPEAILSRAAATLDFTRPTALMLMGILGLVEDFLQADGEPRFVDVERLLPTGRLIASQGREG